MTDRTTTTTALVAKPPRPLALRRGDHEFLPAALEILETPLSPVRCSLIVTICAFAVAALTWSTVSRIDIIATAQGKIQPVGRTKTIQPVETGKVAGIPVENGRRVAAGEVLLVLDAGETRADEATLTTTIQSKAAEAARRRTALAAVARRGSGDVPPIAFDPETPPALAARERRVLQSDLGQLASTVASLEGQAREKAADRDQLEATIAAQETLVATLKERVDMRQMLQATNSESRAKVIDALELMQTQAATLASEKGQLGSLAASLDRIAHEVDKAVTTFSAENAQKLADAERSVDEDREKLAKARVRTGNTVLRSPIDGTVSGLTVSSVGQVVTVGEQVMQIVPQDARLEIECYLPNADVGFVHVDQQAVVKVDSFPFTDYGTVDATVTRVARDAIPEPDAESREGNPASPGRPAMFGGAQRVQNLVFPATLTMSRTSMASGEAEVPLMPGMAVTVEIKTGTRRIISYLFSPLIQVARTAFRER